MPTLRKNAMTKLEAFFGVEARALDITPTANDAYAAQRLDARAAGATVNYELAALRRALRLAIKKRLLAVRPEFELPKVQNERQGFFGEGDFAALLLELAKIDTDVRDYVEFKRYTGWRDNEGLVLGWPDVDRDGEVIRIAARDTKGGESRLFDEQDLASAVARRFAPKAAETAVPTA
jgi:integrase